MPNLVDSVNTLFTTIQSGLVVSGNSYISVAKQVTSGDALASFRISGMTDFIGLRLQRNETKGLTGGVFTEVADYVVADISIHGTYAKASGQTETQTLSGLRQRVDDFKITVASGTWSGTNPARPILVSESWSLPHEKAGKAELVWRFRYLQ